MTKGEKTLKEQNWKSVYLLLYFKKPKQQNGEEMLKGKGEITGLAMIFTIYFLYQVLFRMLH